jgi:hypothetical protein
MEVQLNDREELFQWNLTTSGIFTVKSFCLNLLNGHIVFLKRYIWKTKFPLKIKIFMWFLHKKVIVTKNNLVKRN